MPTSRSILVVAARVLTRIGLMAALFVAFEFFLTGLTHDRNQPALLANFEKQLHTTTLDVATSSPPEASPVAVLEIARIGLHQVVVEGTSPEDLRAGPGHLRASPVPGEYGNAVIAGRRTTYGGPFGQLDQLRPGDPIVVTTGQGVFIYMVSGVGHVGAGQPAPFIGTADSRMTLVTSDSAFLPTGRLVAVAKLHGPPIAVPNRPPVPIAAADLGLAGDPNALFYALLWAPLLVAVAWAVRRARRHWPVSVTSMLALPVVLTLVVLTFSGIDPVLPGLL